MPNGDPPNRFFYLTLTVKENGRQIKHSYILIAKLMHIVLALYVSISLVMVNRVSSLLCFHITIN